MDGNSTFDRNIRLFRDKMLRADTHPVTMETFEQYYKKLCTGETGVIREKDLVPVESLKSSEGLKEFIQQGSKALHHTVVIKLNGGLGTSMGLDRAKSLLEVKPGLTFLDIIVGQNQRMRADYNASIPLIFMNSIHTQKDTLNHIQTFPDLATEGLPADFLQNRVPKIRQCDYAPAEYPLIPEMEWNPPGHGDIYASLLTSGTLELLLQKGYRYAFISNADNLGAELCPSILGYVAHHQFSFLMEVAERTDADRKGGHLARHTDGYLILREKAQCADTDDDNFSDIHKHRYFNTNSIWINLDKLYATLVQSKGILDLPLICNRKTVNPQDRDSEPVYQMETAMGAAISTFENTSAVCVPRDRFLPVKTTDDLIGLWSDAYCVSDAFRVALCTGRHSGVISKLDRQFYSTIEQLHTHFPYGAPSLKDCQEWTVHGDVIFESNVVVTGCPTIDNRSNETRTVSGGTVVSRDVLFS